jgi:hypothetical protein
MPMWKRFDHLGLIHHENAQHRLHTDVGRALPSRQGFSAFELVLRLALFLAKSAPRRSGFANRVVCLTPARRMNLLFRWDP